MAHKMVYKANLPIYSFMSASGKVAAVSRDVVTSLSSDRVIYTPHALEHLQELGLDTRKGHQPCSDALCSFSPVRL
eukprot:1151434-Pelagomonas_calceolata.AAC.6